MSENDMKKGNVYRWNYTEEQRGKMTGDIYWCKSRIAIFDGKWLTDTFWGNSSSDLSFSKEDVSTKIEVTFLANMDDLESSDPSMRAYYLDADCVDLNHPNSTRGNFYIRKGSVKNLAKMERILRREKAEHEYSIRSTLRSIELLEKELKNVTEHTFVSPKKDTVSLDDKTWEELEAEAKP